MPFYWTLSALESADYDCGVSPAPAGAIVKPLGGIGIQYGGHHEIERRNTIPQFSPVGCEALFQPVPNPLVTTAIPGDSCLSDWPGP